MFNLLAENIFMQALCFQCSCICACSIREQTLLARCLGYFLTEFDQTFTTNGLWGKDEHVKFWGQKIKGRGHSEVKYVSLFGFVVVTCWRKRNS